ncbi:MAG: hypothetical protein EOO36_21885 [Cytophagaceae bacterium]|nr:MAG: hypothetical protein EOO36_21885 [Cytophagaceae bacterium]
MKPCLLFLCLLALPALTYAQRAANPQLKHELDSLYYVDQIYREAMFGEKKQHLMDSIAAARHFPVAEAPQRLVGLMLATDTADMRRVRAIIRRYGYPGQKLVGTPANEAAFYVIQHSNSIPQYLPLIKQAADQGELPFRLYAMMLDRYLMELGKPQVYGTQGRSYSGQAAFIWPIADPAHVNERRRKAGFELSVEDNDKRLNIPYHVLTVEDVRKMPGYQAPTP